MQNPFSSERHFSENLSPSPLSDNFLNQRKKSSFNFSIKRKTDRRSIDPRQNKGNQIRFKSMMVNHSNPQFDRFINRLTEKNKSDQQSETFTIKLNSDETKINSSIPTSDLKTTKELDFEKNDIEEVLDLNRKDGTPKLEKKINKLTPSKNYLRSFSNNNKKILKSNSTRLIAKSKKSNSKVNIDESNVKLFIFLIKRKMILRKTKK